MCGHATLAAAAWVFNHPEYGVVNEIVFESISGPLHCFKKSNGAIEIDLPELPVQEAVPEEGLLAALGICDPIFVGKSKCYFLIEVSDPSIILKLKPRFNEMKELNTPGAFVTSKGYAPFDFVSRCFFPKEGIPEDPVTGSAHCSLGPFWRRKLSKDVLSARQASQRGGDILIRFGDTRVILGGLVRLHLRPVVLSSD